METWTVDLRDGTTKTFTAEDIPLGEMVWVPYHSWDENTEQVDARIVRQSDGTEFQGLDIWSTKALIDDLDAWYDAPGVYKLVINAQIAWAKGSVFFTTELFNTPTLVVPGDTVQVKEALRRFQP